MVHGDRSVDVFVRKLRQKLERASPGWRYIHTHFGIGYRFAAEPASRSRVGARRCAVAGAGVGRRGCVARRRSAQPVAACRDLRPRGARVDVRRGPGPQQEPPQHRDHPRAGGRRLEAPGRRHRGRDDREHLLGHLPRRRCSSSATAIYMENRETIFGLEERQRGILYGALALLAFALVATSRMWDAGGLGAHALAAPCSAPPAGRMYSVWRAYRTY